MADEIKILLQAIQEAGEAILTLQKKDLTIIKKANNDIVTKADLRANEILKSALLNAFPDDGWLSEESVDDAKRLSCNRIWVVDPIDGTREYASGIPHYAVSVALVEKGVPILAALFNPASDELFYAIAGQGAWLNKKKIYCRAKTSEALIFLASRSEYHRGEWDNYISRYHVKPIGSIAYKMALLAAGEADATLSLGCKNEWDIAAGTLIVTEAKGVVTNKHREKLLFNQESVKVDGVIATTAQWSDQIFSIIQENELA